VSEIFESTGVSVDVENDVVVLRVGDKIARFSYTSAFMVAQRMRLVSNMAGRIAGVSSAVTAELKRKADESNLTPINNAPPRDSSAPWDVWNEGEIVAVRLGLVTARWEVPAALTIAGWIREGGRQAKNWAGDTSKTLRIAGILTDAEENRRLAN